MESKFNWVNYNQKEIKRQLKSIISILRARSITWRKAYTKMSEIYTL